MSTSNSAFGLQNQDGRFFSVGVDYSPAAHVDVFADYGYEKYGTLQKSRQANPGTQEFDPTRDWTTDGSDHAHTFTAGVSLKRLKEKVDADWMLEYSNASRQLHLRAGAEPDHLRPAGGAQAVAGVRPGPDDVEC